MTITYGDILLRMTTAIATMEMKILEAEVTVVKGISDIIREK